MRRKMISLVLTLAMVCSLFPMKAAATTESVTYRAPKSDRSGYESVTQTCTYVTAGDTEWGTDGETSYYAVSGLVEHLGSITVKGDVHLILKDGAALYATATDLGFAGIIVSDSENSLTIYGQTEGSGSLYAYGNGGGAGIGGIGGQPGNNITVNGGCIYAQSGGSGGAGIGGGFGGKGINIRVNGGSVTAIGSRMNDWNYAAGIGSGYSEFYGCEPEDIYVNTRDLQKDMALAIYSGAYGGVCEVCMTRASDTDLTTMDQWNPNKLYETVLIRPIPYRIGMGGSSYGTFAEALAQPHPEEDAAHPTVIALLGDLAEEIEIPKDRNIEFRLNDHILSVYAYSFSGSIVTNNGKLSIIGSDPAADETAVYFAFFDENGTLWLEPEETQGSVPIHGAVVVGSWSSALLCETAFNPNAEMTVRNVNFLLNEDYFSGGGGAITSLGNANIENCRFLWNGYSGYGGVNSYGGAVYIGDGAHALIKDCEFAENIAEHGGAIYISKDSVTTIINTDIHDNYATNGGGGVYAEGDDMCLVEGTLITMADGSRKPIEDVADGAYVRCFDHDTGAISSAKVCLAFRGEGQALPFTLHFTNDISLGIVGVHDLLEHSSLQYMTLTRENAESCIGKEFYNADANRWETLLSVEYGTEAKNYYSIYTSGLLNCVANGMLTVPDDVDFFLNVFELREDLSVDPEKKQADLEKYGIFPYEDCEFTTEEDYENYRIAYTNVVVGKGLASYERLFGLRLESHEYSVEQGRALPIDGGALLFEASPAEQRIDYDSYTEGVEDGTLLIGTGTNISRNYLVDRKTGEILRSCDLHIDQGIVKLIDGAKDVLVGVEMTTPGAFTLNGSIEDLEQFYSNDSLYDVIFNMDHLELGKHTHCACDSTGCSGEGHEPLQEWENWIETERFPETAGYYFLSRNVATVTDWVVPDGLVLCLNGQAIECGGITVPNGVHATITDCGENKAHYFRYQTSKNWTRDESAKENALVPASIQTAAAVNTPVRVNGGCICAPIALGEAKPAAADGSLTLLHLGLVGSAAESGSRAAVELKENGLHSVLTLSGCTLLGAEGCGVLGAGTVSLQDCDFSYVSGTAVSLSGGTAVISGVSVQHSGCGLALTDTLTATLTDLTVERNEVGIRNEASVVYSGRCVVRNNGTVGAAKNLVFETLPVVGGTGLTDGSEIGLSVGAEVGIPTLIAVKATESNLQYFRSDAPEYRLRTGENDALLLTGRSTVQRDGLTLTAETDTSGLSGTPAISYQWFRNGTLLQGETGKTLLKPASGTNLCQVTINGFAALTDGMELEDPSVAFDTVGGGSIATQTVIFGTAAVRPEDPARAESDFNGWYLNGTKYDFETPVGEDITLTARWILNETEPGEETVVEDDGSNTTRIQVIGDTDVRASGLEEVAKAVRAAYAGVDIKVVLTARSTEESLATPTEVAAIKAEAAGKKLELLTIDLTRYLAGSTDGTPIPVSGSVIEVLVPFETSGKRNLSIYRYHEGEGVAEFTEKTEETAGADATFYVKDEVLHLFTRKFSTYAIGYESSNQAAVWSGAYSVSAGKTQNGSVSVSSKSAREGTTVTLTVSPDEGYELEKLSAVNAAGKELTLTVLKAGESYSFRMPASGVTISAAFVQKQSTERFFEDVKKTDYFYDAVQWAAQKGITNGVDETHFKPFGVTSRAEMVTFLWRTVGSPEPLSQSCAFTDLKQGSFYEKAVLWAVENGIAKGTSRTTFSPGQKVTRGQAVAFLARFYGVTDEAEGYTQSFTDVRATDYYNNAVAWATERKITDGTGDQLFSPKSDCIRGQIVTFLYRNFANPEE